MKKIARIQIRIDSATLSLFDDMVGEKNRSKRIKELIQKDIHQHVKQSNS
jgi:metal-responsive CopG/Arc/MetJ family transcriptional regulator